MSASQPFTLHAKDSGRALVLENALRFIGQLPASKSWRIEIARYVKPESRNQQEARFGLAYKVMMEFSGLQGSQEKLELHRFMCGEFFGWRETEFGRRPARTTTKNELGKPDKITTEVAAEFFEFIRRRAADVGCFIPDPDPFWREAA